MVLNVNEVEIQQVLAEAVTTLYRSKMIYNDRLRIQGLIGVTVNSDVHIVQIDKNFEMSSNYHNTSETSTQSEECIVNNTISVSLASTPDQFNDNSLFTQIKSEFPDEPELGKNKRLRLSDDTQPLLVQTNEVYDNDVCEAYDNSVCENIKQSYPHYNIDSNMELTGATSDNNTEIKVICILLFV